MGVATASGAEEWAQVLTTSFVPLAVGALPDTFTGTVEQRAVGADLQLSAVDCGPSQVSRTGRLARASTTDDLLFAMHLGGLGVVEQHGRAVELVPGTAVMYDTSQPYELRFPSRIQELVLQVPRRSIPLDQAALSDACARRIDGTHPTLRILRAFSTELLNVAGDLNPRERHDISHTAAGLIGSVLSSHRTDTDPAGDTALFHRITQYIRDNLGDPTLTAQTLADTHHISLRYLYLLFDKQGCTPAARIREQRLRAAHHDLATGPPRQKIAVVAARYGFNDVTTFTRAFRRHFGTTPLGWRQTAA